EVDRCPIVAMRFACANSICASRYRRSLSRTAASALFRSVKSITKATPSSPFPSKFAAPTSTGTRLPFLWKISFSYVGRVRSPSARLHVGRRHHPIRLASTPSSAVDSKRGRGSPTGNEESTAPYAIGGDRDDQEIDSGHQWI